MSKLFGLDKSTIEALTAIFEQFPQLDEVILYGSRAKGNYRKSSDIDLTLKGANLEATELLRIENSIDDLMLPYKIDLSIFSHIENPELLEHIARVGISFYRRS